jgi:outer membrane protein assembly factor BamB
VPAPARLGPLLVLLTLGPPMGADAREDLWAAARRGDVKAVQALLDRGTDVNVATDYGATALWFAAYKGRPEVVRLLLERKAEVNVRDAVWGETPLTLAVAADQPEVVQALLRAGAAGGDALVIRAAGRGQVDLLRRTLEAIKPAPEALSAALLVAPPGQAQVAELLDKAGAKPFPADAGAETAGGKWDGMYTNPNGLTAQVAAKKGRLVLLVGNDGPFVLKPVAGGSKYQAIAQDNVSVTFEGEGDPEGRFVLRRGDVESVYRRGVRKAEAPTPKPFAEPAGRRAAPAAWPSFRGPHASGVADGQFPPATWDVPTGRNVRWRTPIPGLAHSSPIVWGDRVFVTTAVSQDPKTEFKPGLYGAGTTAKDVTPHAWRVYCLGKRDGKVLWERTAHEGVPKTKRHIKSSHANATPATDGKHFVAFFASEGLYCYDLDGNPRWKQDLGVIDAGAFSDPDLQWGAGSSPVLYQDLVIIQCDGQKNSFLAAYRLADGERVWRTPRDEPPSWATPTVCPGPAGDELVVNGSNFIRGYDPRTGQERWRLGPNSKITTPTPVFGHGLVFVTNGYRPIQPIYAVRPGGSGDISLKKDEDANTHVAWAKRRGGPYMPTPVLYGEHFYVCSNAGVLTCYEARTGKQVYQQNLGGDDGYSASPVAADGKLYFTAETGEIRVVRAGPAFELLAVNRMGEPCMATPAIGDGMLFVRTQHGLFGLGRGDGE